MFSSHTNMQFDWAHHYLLTHEFKLEGALQSVRVLPWSQVYSVKTSQGIVYLKSLAAPFAKEPLLLKFLFSVVSQKVPEIIASNEEYQCFLMKDNGLVLRDQLKKHYDLPIISEALQIYTDIQIKSIPYIDKLVSKGINDWRLRQVPHFYQNFITKEDSLKAEGLNAFEIDQLFKITDKISIICERLSSFGIPETLEHGDFHDNNILIQHKDITINDWADASITHPFFSCAAFLNSAQRNHNLLETDKNYLYIKKCYLDAWKVYQKEKYLEEAFELAKILHHFIFALSFVRIKSCPGVEQFPQYNGYIANAFRDLLKNLTVVDL